MSIQAMNCAWQYSKHKGGDLLVLLAIADHTGNENGLAWPSMGHLAAKCRMTHRNARRCVQALLQSGELILIRQGDGKKSSVYRVDLNKLEKQGGQIVPPRAVREDAHDPAGGSPMTPESSLNHQTKSTYRISPDVERIYAAYPRKVAKPHAIRAIRKALVKVTPNHLLERTEAFAKAWADTPPNRRRFIPYPATWFNAEGYNDDEKEWALTATPPPAKRISSFELKQRITACTDEINRLWKLNVRTVDGGKDYVPTAIRGEIDRIKTAREAYKKQLAG